MLQLTVIVGDVNDNSPICPALPTIYALNSTQPSMVIFTVTATDADAGSNGKITYELQSTIYQETNFLAIDSMTGELSTLA